MSTEEGITLYDEERVPYTADADMQPLLAKHRIWTAEDGTLWIAEVSYKQKATLLESPLAQWWFRICARHDLPKNLQLTFINGNQRDVRYSNLERIGGTLRHVQLPTITDAS